MRVRAGWGWALAIALCASAALVGCGGSDDPAAPGPNDTGTMPASVRGIAYRVPSGGADAARGDAVVIFDSPASAPAGATAVAGAAIAVVNVAGSTVAQGTTGTDGGFTIENLPHGLLTIEVRAPGSSQPDASLPVTAIPDVLVALGRVFPVSRDSAAALVLVNAPANALVLGTLEPLPAGVAVYPARTGAASSFSRAAPADEWFFVVDLDPAAHFGHPLQYVSVNATTAAVVSIDGPTEPPRINGARFWASDFDWVRYRGIDFSDFDPDNLPPGLTAEYTEEIVRAPEEPEGASIPVRTAARGPSASTTASRSLSSDDLFLITVIGSNRSDFNTDFLRANAFFRQAGVSAFNTFLYITPSIASIDYVGAYITGFNALNAKMLARLRAGGQPTLFLVVSGHQYLSAETGLPNGEIEADFSDGIEIGLGAGFFRLPSAHACRIVVLLETCFAKAYGEEIADLFRPLPQNERPDLKIFVACAAGERARGRLSIQETLFGGKAGGTFMSTALALASVENNDVKGLLDNKGEIVPELQSLRTGLFTQHPDKILVPGYPQYCADALLPLITANRSSIAFTHIVGTTPCPQPLGTILITNPSREAIIWSATSNNNAIDFAPFSGMLEPGASISISVQFDCTALPPFTGIITIGATRPDGTRTESVQVSVMAARGIAQ